LGARRIPPLADQRSGGLREFSGASGAIGRLADRAPPCNSGAGPVPLLATLVRVAASARRRRRMRAAYPLTGTDRSIPSTSTGSAG
jgi:hypothetical protein